MYVRDELGGFSECAYSLLLSISFLLTHREAVTGYPAGHRLFFVYTPCAVDLACGEMSILLVDL